MIMREDMMKMADLLHLNEDHPFVQEARKLVDDLERDRAQLAEQEKAKERAAAQVVSSEKNALRERSVNVPGSMGYQNDIRSHGGPLQRHAEKMR
jgi:hypothetical protein